MRVDSRTVAVAAAGVLVTVALGAQVGSTAGAAAGVIASLAGLAGSAVVTIVQVRQSQQAAEETRTQELLEMFAPPRPLDDRADQGVSPGERPALSVARYLRADEQVVPFRGRPELDELLAWCGAGGRVRVRLVTGDGGAGKTRLALRLCNDLSARGWRSLWVRPGREEHAAEAVRKLGPCVLVVDYAETRDGLRPMLSDVVADAAAPDVRAVLLARGPGEWWQRLAASSEEQMARLLVEPPVVLGPIQVEGGPARLFDEALTAFADKLEVPRPDVPLALADPDPVMLEVHAAALLAVLDHAQESAAVPARSAAEVLDGLLGHEGRYWAQSATARGLDLDVAVQRLAVAVGCLIGADSEAAAAELMRRIPDLSDSAERRGQVARWLHDLYPEPLPTDDGPGAWLGPLRPDPVAERLILTELEARPELVSGLFTGLSGDQAVHGLTVLARASLRAQSGIGLIRSVLAADLEHLAAPALSVAMSTNLVLGDLLNEALGKQAIPAGPLRSAADAIPYPSFALAPVAVTVLTMLADQSEDIGERADHLLRLSSRLADLGRREESLAAAEESVQIRRRQAEAEPGTFRPALALALNDQTNPLGALGRWEDARASAEEAVQIRRDLARDSPGAFLPDLAMSLNNLAWCLNELGRPGQALAAADESAEIRRGLVKDRPELLSSLAATLNNRSISLAALNRPQEALAAVEEGTGIYRDLAQTRPDAFLSTFARSLNNLSNILAGQCSREEALAAVAEATRIFRLLALIRPGGYLRALADSLHNQSLCLAALGRHPEAMASMAESTHIRQLLTQGGPDPPSP